MKDILVYYDPNHGNCLRKMTPISENKYVINGAYGSDEGKKGHWVSFAEKIDLINKNGRKYNLKVDFSLKNIKTHEPIYYAYMHNRKIEWQDGNTWLQLYA